MGKCDSFSSLFSPFSLLPLREKVAAKLTNEGCPKGHKKKWYKSRNSRLPRPSFDKLRMRTLAMTMGVAKMRGEKTARHPGLRAGV